MQIVRDHVDPLKPVLPSYEGTFIENLDVAGMKRRIFMYIPPEQRSWCPAVMILGDDGVSAEDVFEKGGWKAIADTDEYLEKAIIICVESLDTGWNLQEEYGRKDGDIAYLEQAYLRMMHRSMFAVAESKCYIIGYGKGGTMAEMFVMYNPAVWSAAAAVGPFPVNETYRKAAGSDICSDLNGFIDDTGLGLKKGEIPVPFWLASDSEGPDCIEDAAYWEKALGVDETAIEMSPDVYEYHRTRETPSPINQDKKAYKFRYSRSEKPQKNCGYYWNRRIFRLFLDTVRRWRSQPGGDLRCTIRMMNLAGMEYHTKVIGGWLREWYVYTPENVRREPDVPAPLVFAFHGYTCSGEIYAGNSGWNDVADRYGFIVIYPSAVNGKQEITETNIAVSPDMTVLPAWNYDEKADAPDEQLFFSTMLKEVKESHCVDMTKIYITGHSMGSLMTQYLSVAHPEIFAASAPCSGVLFWDLTDKFSQYCDNGRIHKDLPIWMFGGEREEWLLPPIPEGDNITAKTIRFWWRRNHMPGKEPVYFTDGWNVKGVWNDLVYRKNGKDMIRYTWVKHMPHATMPEMSFRIWEEFFSKNVRD